MRTNLINKSIVSFCCRGPVLQRTACPDPQLRAVEGQQRHERRKGKGERVGHEVIIKPSFNMLGGIFLEINEFSWMGVSDSMGRGSIPAASMGFLLSKTRLEIFFYFDLFSCSY